MKIVTKFAVVFAISTAASLVVYATVRAGREAHRFEQEAQDELTAVGELVRSELRDTPGDIQRAALLSSIASVQRRDLVIRYAPPGQAQEVQLGADYIYQSIKVCASSSGENSAECGTLTLSHVTKSRIEMLRADLREELLAVSAMALLTSLLALVFGNVLVTRPLARLTAQAKRVGAGDFTARLRHDRSDELGVLKRELNVMCEQLASARTQLEDEATARIETLEQLRHLDRLRSVGTVASSLAHELGTPLNVILLRAQAMVEGETTDAEELALTGQTIVGQVEKMSRLVRELLHFSRAQRAPRGPADIASVASGVISLLSTIAKKHKVDLRYEGPDCVPIHGNAAQLEQAVTNLVINGIQAMPHGGRLTMTAKPQTELQRPHSDRASVVVRLEVRDEGHGIAEEKLAQIFEPFYTTKSEDTGTGLGLSVAKGIIDEHGGWISATSALGIGSTFTLFLPVYDV
jgi:signal transduction histidine kinase